MTKLLCLSFGALLMGCEANPIYEGAIPGCEPGCVIADQPVSMRINVDGIEDGMSRDQVMEVLGEDFSSHVPLDWEPSIDSFPYVDENGDTRFVHVSYQEGKVVSAIGDRRSVYFVF